MSLSTVTSGVALRPPRILLMGTPGIGKTTWAAQAPAPIFICCEEGADTIGVARFPLAKSFQDVMNNLRALATEKHDYATVVIDSLDPLEQLIVDSVNTERTEKECAYGKGVLFANDKWRDLLNGLTWLRDNKNMIVILIAHTSIKRFDNPETDPYDRYVPRLHEKGAGIICGWVDAMLFANYKIYTKETEVGFNKDVRRALGTGERTIFTSERPAYMAKSRYAIPHELPMNWQAFQNAVTASASKAETRQPASQLANQQGT